MVLLLLAVVTFTMGLNAIQKGEVALSRTKTITGQAAKTIGVVLIALSLLIGLLIMVFSVMNGMANNNFGLNPTPTSAQP